MEGGNEFDAVGFLKSAKVNRRLIRKLTSKCRYCSGYEEKINQKDQNPVYHEIAEMEKHELLNRMAAYMGSDPARLSDAEHMFEDIKYCITEYVLKHEFNEKNGLSVQVALWLEKRKEPDLYKPLENIIHTYLKPGGIG